MVKADRFTKIKVFSINNKAEFFKTVEKCKGQVYLTTEEGDELNLKSKLCQYITTLDVFQNDVIGDFSIKLSNPEDAGLLFEFLVQQ